MPHKAAYDRKLCQLICERIDDATERRNLMQTACGTSVKKIRHGGQTEDRQRIAVLLACIQPYKLRYQQYAVVSQDVGNGKNLFYINMFHLLTSNMSIVPEEDNYSV